jgi:SCP-2 sterol transfer family
MAEIPEEGAMPRFLTQDWLDELKRVSSEALSGGMGVSAAVQWHVTGGSDGDVAYYWRVQDGTLSDARLGTIPDPDFVVTMSYDDAARMQRGDVELDALFRQNRIDVIGTAWSSPAAAWRNLTSFLSVLCLSFSPESAEIQDKLRAVTTY